MIAWLVIAVILGVLAGLATHVCADAADPGRRRLRAEFEAEFEAWKNDYVREWHWTWKRLDDEKVRLAALERKLRRREDLLRDRENYAATLKKILEQLTRINKRLDAVDGGYGYLLGQEDDVP